LNICIFKTKGEKVFTYNMILYLVTYLAWDTVEWVCGVYKGLGAKFEVTYNVWLFRVFFNDSRSYGAPHTGYLLSAIPENHLFILLRKERRAV